jgi:DNA-binding protein HU-beta
MNKAQLVSAVARDLRSSKAAAERAVNAVLGNIKKNANRGVNLIGFGTFSVVKRGARTGRNPQTGGVMHIKASRVVRFKAGKAFKERL